VSEVFISKRREQEGIVIKQSGKDTVSVQIQGLKPHPLYGKVMKIKSNYLVHDPENVSKVGDKVLIRATRPISKLKRWKIANILVSAKVEEAREIKPPKVAEVVKKMKKTTVKKGASKKS